MTGENNPPAAAIWALLGAASSMGFAAIGAAYGTAKAGNGIAMIAQRKPALMMKAIVPVVMAGVLGIYGLVVSVLIVQKAQMNMTYFQSFKSLAAGLTTGLSGIAAGYCTGIIAETGLEGTSMQPRLFIGMVLILAWCQALGLYGLLSSLILGT